MADKHGAEVDRVRTNYLEDHGFRVLRFWNNEVLTNLEAVRATILAALNDQNFSRD